MTERRFFSCRTCSRQQYTVGGIRTYETQLLSPVLHHTDWATMLTITYYMYLNLWTLVCILGQKRNAAYKTYIVYGDLSPISRKRFVSVWALIIGLWVPGVVLAIIFTERNWFSSLNLRFYRSWRRVVYDVMNAHGLTLFQIVRNVSERSVELPKTTHLPKTTENHLENQVYMGIMPS